ncbi:MAG: DUF2191 domain-containing protein [Acidobacteria bacterium]|nr:DUF2191 domain-containing protein [Acidobacteriota bacterium]
MRTTVEINDSLFVLAKKKAAAEGVPLRQIIEDALRTHLQGPTTRAKYRFLWTVDSGRLLPGVDLEDRDSLFDIMDGLK